eukprot:scaffold25278_cov33-Phaeocystis_antarctica.AAC.2
MSTHCETKSTWAGVKGQVDRGDGGQLAPRQQRVREEAQWAGGEGQHACHARVVREHVEQTELLADTGVSHLDDKEWLEDPGDHVHCQVEGERGSERCGEEDRVRQTPTHEVLHRELQRGP